MAATATVRWMKPVEEITDRQKRYRANHPAIRPKGPRKCALCPSRRFIVVDHRDGDESNYKRSNLRYLCKSCNTREGIRFAREGRGVRTRQFNPGGAKTLGQYVAAVVEHKRGMHDAGGKVIHETPAAKRKQFAREIWNRRRFYGTDKPSQMRNPKTPFDVVFRRKGKITTWVRFADTVREAKASAREALQREYPLRDYSLISVKPSKNDPRKANGLMRDLGRAVGHLASKLLTKRSAKSRHTAVRAARRGTSPRPTTLTRTAAAPATRKVASPAVRDVIEALRGQGYKAAQAKSMATLAAQKTGSNEFEPLFRAALATASRLPNGGKRLTTTTKARAAKRRKPSVARAPLSRRNGAKKKQRAKKVKRNPGSEAAAARVYEMFHGKPSSEVITVLQAQGVPREVADKVAKLVPPEDYAGLGSLCELQVLDARGQGHRIAFSKNERPRLCCNPEATQLYFVGGNQDVSQLLADGVNLGFGLVDLGECVQIEYLTRKAFDNFTPVQYYHQFGEENGIRPRLLYSPAVKTLYLLGGDYKIKPEGIVN